MKKKKNLIQQYRYGKTSTAGIGDGLQICRPSTRKLRIEIVENDLVFAGLVGMIDPERAEAADAVRLAKEAGIRQS